MTAHALEQSFEARIEARLAQLQTGQQMGFSDMRRRLEALEQKGDQQPGQCAACRDGILERVEATRQESRTLVKEATKEVVAEMLTKNKDHETRLRTLEKGRWRKDGILAVASAVLALAGRWILAKVW